MIVFYFEMFFFIFEIYEKSSEIFLFIYVGIFGDMCENVVLLEILLILYIKFEILFVILFFLFKMFILRGNRMF